MNKFFTASAMFCMVISSGCLGPRAFYGDCVVNKISDKPFDNAPTTSRTIEAFKSITVPGAIEVIYYQSDKNLVELEGDQTLFDSVTTVVSDGTLTISLKPGTYDGLWMRAKVYSPGVNSFKVSGIASLEAAIVGHNAEDVDIKVTGTGNVQIDSVSAKTVDAKVSGTGSLTVGSVLTSRLSATTSGTGDIKISDLEECADASLSASGTGNIYVSGKADKVDASVSGTGTVKGDLKYNSIDKHESGVGKINL